MNGIDETKLDENTGQIRKALVRLDAALDRLEKVIKSNDEKLKSVLRNEPREEKPKDMTKKDVGGVLLAIELSEFETRINDFVERLAYTQDRIEL